MVNDGEAEGISKKLVAKNKQRKEKKQFVKDSTVDDKTQKVVTSREDSNLSDAVESSKESRKKAGEDLYRSGKVKHNMKKEASFEDTLNRGDLHKDKSEKDMAIKKHEEAPEESSSFWGSLKSLAAGVIKIWSNKR
ncbi:uncharacterized protein LOC124921908 [Impatiens glandulifera]|uniref:uncharacterized protein LOC124921908 n=1 Tax=Impatiens glandulifera TaxID=253017 RepID=UPI001FB19CEF|nr:uncharacterized protein LOC124921908 [Impatiens glandulifera]